MKYRILLERIIGRVNVESFEELLLPVKKSMKSRAHETLTVTTGTRDEVVIFKFFFYEGIYIYLVLST